MCGKYNDGLRINNLSTTVNWYKLTYLLITKVSEEKLKIPRRNGLDWLYRVMNRTLSVNCLRTINHLFYHKNFHTFVGQN